jgi:hypothetical protein
MLLNMRGFSLPSHPPGFQITLILEIGPSGARQRIFPLDVLMGVKWIKVQAGPSGAMWKSEIANPRSNPRNPLLKSSKVYVPIAACWVTQNTHLTWTSQGRRPCQNRFKI